MSNAMHILNALTPVQKGPATQVAPALGAGAALEGPLAFQTQLAAQGPDGTWRDLPTIRNCLSVHLGSVLEIMTEGRVSATPHRVIDHGGRRQSIGFFLEPGLGVQLAPIKGGAATCDSITGTYGWHLQERFHQQKGYEHLVPRPRVAT